MDWLKQIDKSWTLFLDRDGVINEEISNNYVLHWSDFKFRENVPISIAKLNSIFSKIIVVTNQRCIGKGLLTDAELSFIHENMNFELSKKMARIEKIYYCADIDDNSENRKPQIGMALQAQRDYPEINFGKSIMIGNTPSDMFFGRSAGMKNIFITSTQSPPDQSLYDLAINGLHEFAEMIVS